MLWGLTPRTGQRAGSRWFFLPAAIVETLAVKAEHGWPLAAVVAGGTIITMAVLRTWARWYRSKAVAEAWFGDAISSHRDVDKPEWGRNRNRTYGEVVFGYTLLAFVALFLVLMLLNLVFA